MKTDSGLLANVLEELKWDPKLRDAEFNVSVRNGIVIISGHVANFGIKLAAEEAIKRVKDVKGLAEAITVKNDSRQKLADQEIASAAINAIKWNHVVSEKNVVVEVANGWITLEGNLEWQYQKDAVTNAIKDIVGLKGLTNLILIKPVHDQPVLVDAIKSALERCADIVSDNIIIEKVGSKVILHGKVRSWAERREVERAAWCCPGVKEIDDELIVA